MPKRDTVRRINNTQAKPATRTVGSLKSVTQPPSPSRDLGGWAVGERTISAGDLLLHADGFIRVGEGDDVAVMSVLDELYRFYAGSKTPGSAPYRVTRTGHVTMDDATVKGHIEALTGELHELSILDTLTLATGGEIVSEDYAAGVSGIRLAPTGQSEMLNLLVRGTLRTVVFEKQYVSTVGGTLRVEEEPSGGTVAGPFTVPAEGLPNVFTVYFEEGFGFEAIADDRVAFTDPASGKYGILVFVGAVGLPYGGHLFYNDGEATEGDVFAAGSMAYNLEYESEGYLLLTANPVLKGPRYAVVDTSTGVERLVAVLGNLDGSYGVSGGGSKVFGIGVGDFDSDNYVRWEPTEGFVISAGDGAVLLDEEGLHFDSGHLQEAYRTIRWYADDYAGRDIRQDSGSPTGYANVVSLSTTLGTAGYQIKTLAFQRDVLGVGWYDDALGLSLIATKPGGGDSASLKLYGKDWGDGDHSAILTPPSGKRILLNGPVTFRHPTGYITVPLPTPATSTSFDGDAFSDTARTEIDLSAVFGLPDEIKGVFVRAGARDSGSSGQRCYVSLSGKSGTGGEAVIVDLHTGLPNDAPVQASGFVPCNASGNIYYQIEASGSGTMDIWIEVYGYII